MWKCVNMILVCVFFSLIFCCCCCHPWTNSNNNNNNISVLICCRLQIVIANWMVCYVWCCIFVDKADKFSYSTISIGIDVVNVGVSNSSCFFIFNIWKLKKCITLKSVSCKWKTNTVEHRNTWRWATFANNFSGSIAYYESET